MRRYSSHLKGTDGILFRAYVIVKETGQTTIVQHEFDFAEHEISVYRAIFFSLFLLSVGV